MLQIGSDPEFFLMRNGHSISGHDFPFGTKEAPFKGNTCMIQNDGMALEINVPPMTNEDGFEMQHSLAMMELRSRVREKEGNTNVVSIPTVHFGQHYMKTVPDKVKELGCNPDYNAWTMELNPKPDGTVFFRTGAGHIHLGYVDTQNIDHPMVFAQAAELVRELDYWLGCMSVLWDKDQKRRELYGRAGCFRPKKYGVEYRVLSNFWCGSPKLTRLVFRQAKRCFEHWERVKAGKGELLQEKYGEFAEMVINSGDTRWPQYNKSLAFDIHLEDFKNA